MMDLFCLSAEISGAAMYLLAVAHGIQCLPVRYNRRQSVSASHKPGGRLYTWELPGILIDWVSAGDKVLIHTQRGVRVVTAAAVEESAGNEPEPPKMVIRVKRKGGCCIMAERTERRENLATEIISEMKGRLIRCRAVLIVSLAVNMIFAASVRRSK